MAFPTSSVLDNFSSGAAQNITARTGWDSTLIFPGGTSTLVTDATPTYASGPTSTSYYEGKWGTSFAADQEAWAQVSSVPSEIYLYARVSTTPPTAVSGYELSWIGSAWELHAVVAGVAGATLISGTQTLSSGDSVGLCCQGSTIAVWYKPAASDWRVLGAVVNTTHSGSGKIGVDVKGTVHLDRFGGGAISTIPATATLTTGSLWSANHDAGNYNEWDTTYLGDSMGGHADSGGTTTVDSTHAHSGTYALKMTTNAPGGGDVATRNFRYGDANGGTLPDEAVYEAWFYWDQVYAPTNYWNIMQWKTRTAQSNSDPDWSVNVINVSGAMRLVMFDYHRFVQLGSSGAGSLPANTWHRITVAYRFHVTAGSVTCWLNGTQWYSERGVQTMGATPFYEFEHEKQWSINNYTDGMSPAVSNIWADDAVIYSAPHGELT